MGQLRRWLGMPETIADNVVGTALSTLVLVLVFKFGFGDSWTFALVLALVWAPIAFALVEFMRRRQLRKAAGAG